MDKLTATPPDARATIRALTYADETALVRGRMMELLGADRPEDLAEAYEAAMEVGPAWRSRIAASLDRMARTKAVLAALPR